jgi:hypothetical protein
MVRPVDECAHFASAHLSVEIVSSQLSACGEHATCTARRPERVAIVLQPCDCTLYAVVTTALAAVSGTTIPAHYCARELPLSS